MKRISIVFIPVWLCWLQFGFAQTPDSAPGKQNPLEDSIEFYKQNKIYDKVHFYYLQKAEKLKKDKGESSPEYGNNLVFLGIAQTRINQVQQAESSYLKAIEILTKALGKNHKDVSEAYKSLGILYANLQNYDKAEANFLERVAIEKQIGKDTSDAYLSSLIHLGTFYINSGEFKKAENQYKNLLAIQNSILPANSPKTAETHRHLGITYKEMGDISKVEFHFQKALDINLNAFGKDHMAIALSYNNMGAVSMMVGNNTRAAQYLEKSLEIRKKLEGEESDAVGQSYINLGSVYGNLNQLQKSLICYLKCIEIFKKTRGEKDVFLGYAYLNLSELYKDMGCFQKAESCILQSLEIQKATHGENHPDLVGVYGVLGDLQTSTANYKKSEESNLRALNIAKSRLGPDHSLLGTVHDYLGNLYFAQGLLAKSEMHYKEMVAIRLKELKRNFPSLTDEEKELFFNTYKAEIDWHKSFCCIRQAGNPGILGDLYNLQLATKGLLMNSSAKWKHRIKTSGDLKLFGLYTQWLNLQTELNNSRQSTDSAARSKVDSIQEKSDKIEKELSSRSESFGKLADRKLATWQEVKTALKPGEVAIEMIRINKLGVLPEITDTCDLNKPKYKVKGETDTIQYAALIINSQSVYPEMVLLKNGNDLEGKHLKFYQNSISKQIQDNQSYQQFWEKIGAKLGTSTKVYFSPDGVFHNINLNTLYNPKTKKYLLEEKDIRLVTVTKDIVNPGPAEEDNKLAELVGFPNYYQNTTAQTLASTARKSPEMTYGLRLESMGTLAELPGTKTEVDKIASILESKGWEIKSYTGGSALEQNIKESYKPRLLHIATHGFFQPDSTKGSNPLLRSGLMLAGAGSTLKGEKSETGEDGILTAYEAMNLNLDNTDLVVLSACETGLGEIKNGEGVYGLQRAFKVAGAKSIIMSLWKVDDDATQELMVAFYKHWLAGTSKRVAFLKAQKELKAKYLNPYYWGAFVMVGE